MLRKDLNSKLVKDRAFEIALVMWSEKVREGEKSTPRSLTNIFLAGGGARGIPLM